MVTGDKLKAGDVLNTIAGDVTIIRFDPHPGHEGLTARIAIYEDGGRERGVTVFDGDDFVLVDGVHLYRHLWKG